MLIKKMSGFALIAMREVQSIRNGLPQAPGERGAKKAGSKYQRYCRAADGWGGGISFQTMPSANACANRITATVSGQAPCV